jgi:hypothetical protein
VEGQSGNPSLVAQLRGAMADVRTIWGLDAPQKVDATTGGQPLSGEWVEIRTRILEALGAFPEARVMLAEVLTNGHR